MKWTERLQRAPRDADTPEQAAARSERAVEMGRLLRERRLARGLSLGDAEHTTRINRLYLEALEGARFEVIPAPVYARGFMRSYARYLGLDPEEAVAAIPSDLPRPAGLEPMPGMRRTAPPALPALPAMNAPLLAAIAVVVVLAVIALFVLPRLGGDEAPEDGLTVLQTPASSAPATTAIATPAITATVPPFEAGEMPDFTGVTREEAERVLDGLGVTPLIASGTGNGAPGTVVEQEPEAGTPLDAGTAVTLFIAPAP
ncbi:MAG: hypothetical protein AMXMBFR23_27950 [Chloroflexota bacterium]